jgi:hypothetical protein
MAYLHGRQLFKALDDLTKRIPVVKLERLEAVYPNFKEAAHESLVSNFVNYWNSALSMRTPHPTG